LIQCDGVKDVEIAIQDWQGERSQRSSYCGSSVFDSLSEGQQRVFRRLEEDSDTKPLKDYLSIKIGLVTGNNRFFLMSDDERKRAKLRRSELKPIFPRFHFASGMEFDTSDYEDLISDGGRGFLVSVRDETLVSTEMRDYLALYSAEDIDACSTFKKRPVWSSIEDGCPPDAFFPVMQHHGPRLILNKSGINCTNSVHRAYFSDNVSSTESMLLSLSLLSTFSQISAEICGRSYGSGALKHEPREAEKIQVLMPRLHKRVISSAFRRADKLIRSGNLVEARQFVDQLLLSPLGGEDVYASAALLDSALQKLKSHRQR
jgi:hypothetical protein